MFNENLYNTPYHKEDISKFKFLITGGAGFIGSNIVEYLLKYGAGHVRVLDNLSNGFYENIKDFVGLHNFEFIEGDIRDLNTCKKAVHGMHFVSHQAALGSVPRSIVDPIATNEVNVGGFLNMLVAARESKTCIGFVYAASSSTYGDNSDLPKVEGREGKPLSPYAITKAVNEYYADVFSRIYQFHTVGLRYFNVFGPKQDPNSAYSAVIPIFCKHTLANSLITINGDGQVSRDFTFIENAVQANILAMFSFNVEGAGKHEVYNVACGEQVRLIEVIEMLDSISGKCLDVGYGPERKGDIKHSKADIGKIFNKLGYEPKVNFAKGLDITYNWYKLKFKISE